MVNPMPDQSSAATEHALIQEITAPLATLPDDPLPVVADIDFPIALRGYDRIAVDAYVKRTSQLVAELQATRSPEAAIRRALERVGEEVAGILQRAHETAEQITAQSRSDAEDRVDAARKEAAALAGDAERRVSELDAETDRIWSERHRIVEDARELARQLLALAESAAERFPAAEEPVADEAVQQAAVGTAAEEAAGEVPEADAEVPEGVPLAEAEPFLMHPAPAAEPEEEEPLAPEELAEEEPLAPEEPAEERPVAARPFDHAAMEEADRAAFEEQVHDGDVPPGDDGDSLPEADEAAETTVLPGVHDLEDRDRLP